MSFIKNSIFGTFRDPCDKRKKVYQIKRRRESNLGLEIAPIISSLHKPSAVSVRSSRSGSSKILVRIATTLFPPCAFNSF